MKKRITLRQVAQKAGVHLATAARAMKDDPRVRPETRERIRAVAQTLGYSPDPMLSALSTYRWSSSPTTFHGTLAWITNDATRDGWRCECYDLYHDAARDRAAERGYQLESFWLNEPGMTARRASRILHNRGIVGLLICPLATSRGHLSLEWEKFATVAFGYSMLRPKAHLVTAHHYRAITTAFRRLRSLGHRRIGMAWFRDLDERMDRLWTSAFWSESRMLPESLQIPVLLDKYVAQKPFLEWYEKHRPDAIIVSAGSPAASWLREAGYRVPEEVSVAHAHLQESDIEPGGIVEASRSIGRAAVDLLLTLLQTGEKGIPEFPQSILIEGRWNEGATVAPRRNRTGELAGSLQPEADETVI